MASPLLKDVSEFPDQKARGPAPEPTSREASVIVVGGGFSGLGLGVHLRRRGIRDFLILDRNPQFGGCWWDNTYPGVACDVPSHLYSFSFRQNPNWSRRFAPGAEIQDYLETVAEEEELNQHYRPSTNVTGARWDADTNQWHVKTDQGDYVCTYLIMASGHLVDPKLPEIPGIEDFPGEVLHSAAWDHSVSVEGKRVAVIGTGASAIQVTPEVAKVAEKVTVFQRTPAYLVPRHDTEYSAAQKRTFARSTEALALERANLFWENEQMYPLMRMTPSARAMALKMANDLRDELVDDPEIRAQLTPDYEPGCKRILLAEDFYRAFNRDNVELEDSALERVEGATLISAAGNEVEADVIILCTGFDVSEPKYARVVFGEDGRSLSEHWGEGETPGWTMFERGFPNLVAVNARNTGLGHNSLIYIIESQVESVASLIDWALREKVERLEINDDAADKWRQRISELSDNTVWTSDGGCGAWYIDERTNELTALWPGYAWDFRRRMQEIGPELFDARPTATPSA
ncbi:4-hydroxyacetophenone monooxygenase [Corynebacterium yudongzhengii]|uniref:NAD(P)/FAD-dependent oxidoreductase n=1 Tax=Corynebacterium yudongzhengii TaxID=2080740 RepID=A0A2U1T5E2_9CORY|nr:NAD(P)/FAD-dependent oxidoreductase [Corynebacterium yudongzhengii]AWB81081.1 4-hydroxyacetophenone monooxygenase [Corynebacterium yudongzhengii]PWC01226.1 NAD(P)/FAD-dependent oxidoreductase [Corynebacterium yudongzhengii]